jgi:hypothetical protein
VGWGFYDGRTAEATAAHLLGDERPPKGELARTYMEGQGRLERALYG